MSSALLATLQKMQDGDVITLSAEALPEDTEERKKRKKALILFINSIKDLKSEIKRVEIELSKTKQNGKDQTTNWGKIVAGAKGPFGLITIAALIIVGVSFFVTTKNNTPPMQQPQSASKKAQAIVFDGKKILISQFYIGHGPDCGGGNVPHYHAPSETTVTALDGTILKDPGDCGFGIVKDTKIIEVELTPTANP